MSDVFNKALGSLKLNDFAGELPTAPKIQEPSSLDILREAGVMGQTATPRRQTSIDVVSQLIKMENQKKQLAKLQGIETAKAAIPSWTTAMAGIQGFDALPYESKKAAYDDYVQRAVKGMQVTDQKTDPALLEQQIRDQAPAPVDPTGGKGDFSRGFASYLRNTKAAATGALGFALNKFGQEDVGKSLMATALAYTKEAQDVGKVNDAFTEAVKPDGSLIDYVQFMAGQTIGSVLESAATATIGAAIGGAASGGVAALPSGIAGFFGKSLVKKEVFAAIEASMLSETKAAIKAGATREAALQLAKASAEKKLAQAASRAAGSVGGLLAASGARGVGEIVQNAQQAGIDPSTLSNFNVATGAGIYALAETFSDKLLLDTFLHGVTGSAVKRTLLKGGGIATTEGTTEVVQDVATGIASGAGAPNATSLVNSFAGGFVGGGVIGGGAALARPSGDTTVAPSTTGQTNQPNVDAPVDPNTPIDPTIVPAGTVQEVAGASMVVQPDGSWAYAEGTTPNPLADMMIQQSQQVATQQPGAPGTTVPLNQQPGADPVPLETQLADLLPQVEAGNAEATASAQQLMGAATNEELQAADALAPQGAVAQLADRFGMSDRLFNPYANDANGNLDQNGDLVVGAANPNAAPTAPTAPATPQALSAIDQQLQPLISQIGNNFERAGYESLQQISRIVGQLPLAQRQQELRDNPNGALSAVMHGYGMQVRIEDDPQAAWVQAIQTERDGGQLLQALTRQISFAEAGGQLTRNLADKLRSAFIAARVPFPRVQWHPVAPPVRTATGTSTNYAGSFDPLTNTVNFVPRTTATTVLHEIMHALTLPGFIKIQQRARAGDVEAIGVMALFRDLHAKLITAAGSSTTYGNDSIEEMLAELVRPEFLALAARTQLGTLSEAGRRGANTVAVETNGTVLDAISRMISYVLRVMTGSETIPASSVLAELRSVAAYAAQQSAPDAAQTSTSTQSRVQVTPGQAVAVNTLLEEVQRPALGQTLIDELRSLSPREPTNNPDAARWYFTPGAFVRSYGGRDVVIEATVQNGQLNVLAQSVDTNGKVTGPSRSHGTWPTNMELLQAANQLPAPPAQVNVPVGVRMVPGRELATGTLVQETPRDNALLPNANQRAMLGSLSPDELIGRDYNLNWYFQPGVVVTDSTGHRYVVQEAAHSTGAVRRFAVVQPIDAGNHITGPAIDWATPPTVRNLQASFPAGLSPSQSSSAVTVSRSQDANTRASLQNPLDTQPRQGAADIAVDSPNTSTPESALLTYAKKRWAQRSLVRGVQRIGRSLGSLIPLSATQEQKVKRFVNALRVSLAPIGGTMTVTQPHGVSNQPRFTVRFPTISGAVTGYIDANGYVHVDTQAFLRGSSLGGKFYDGFNGAIISARLKAYNGGYTGANIARLPINRLRAILKWGAITGDFANAATALTTLQSARNNPSDALSAVVEANAIRVDRVYPNARLSDDGQSIVYDNGTISVADMNARTANTARSGDAMASAASPDAVLLIALMRRLGGANRQAITSAAADPIFATVFSYGEGGTPETEAQTAEVDNSVRPDRRTSVATLSQNMRNGVPATPATAGRGLVQAAQARDSAGVARALRAFGEKMNEELHDATVKMKRWLQSLPEGEGGVAPLLKQRVIGAMYTARKLRNEMLRRANDAYLKKIDKGIAAFARKHNISIETAQRDIGYAITATYVPEANARLIQQRVEEIAELQRQVDEAKSKQEAAVDPNGVVPEAQSAMDAAPTVATSLEELQAQLSVAQRNLLELVNAVHNTNITVARHGGGGVAGMNNAQAADMLAGLRQRHGAAGMAEIEAIAETLYDLNAWKLALDVETGKVTPAIAAKFLRNAGALEAMQELRDMANAANAEDKAGVIALESKRKQVMALVRSKYVPLSGDPTKDIDDSSFHGGSGIPNVQQDYRLQGRERGLPPDDGISTSRAALMKSASYAGWRDFQDGIAAVHRSLSPENRTDFGLRSEPITPGRSTLSNKAVVRYRNGKATAYIFNDESLVDSIRGANRLENNFLLEGMGKVTKFYAYMATQANPFFAPFNFIRDSWERNEIMRTRTYLDATGNKVNSSKLSNAMLKYLASPELLQATARHAFGKTVNNNSRMGRYLEEFLRQGGVSTFSSQFSADRAKMVAQINKQKGWREQLSTLAHYVEGYNKTLDLGPALAAFVSMRDAGMTPKDAAAGSLDLMDFGKRGKSANVLGAVYAFSQPTFTGAANALGALRDPVSGKWNKVGVTRLAGYAIGLTMLQAFLRSLADDDEGGNKLDQQSPFMKNNFLLIPFGDDGFIKVPLAYGLTRVANGIARAALGVSTDEQSPAEALGKLASGSVIPVFSPIEDSDIDWSERPVQAFLTLLSPSWMKPAVALATNVTPFDTGIVNEKYGDPTKFKSEQYGKFIPEDYKAIAQFMRKTVGIDMAPEEVRYLVRSYPTGIAQLALNGIVEKPEEGFTGAAQQKVYAGYSEYSRYFQFKKAIDETDDLLKRTKAGETISDDMERKKLLWRLQWDEQDKELRSAKGKATRAAQKLGLTKDAAKDSIDGQFGDTRMAAQVRALYRYRLMQGKDATVGAPPDLTK